MSDRHNEAKLARAAEANEVAERCSITPQEASALLDVRDLLRSGTVKHVTCMFIGETSSKKPQAFNMSCARARSECGTVSCYGGWMASMMGKRDYQFYINIQCSYPLNDLFYPNVPWDGITPQRAADVADRFAQTGVVDWSAP